MPHIITTVLCVPSLFVCAVMLRRVTGGGAVEGGAQIVAVFDLKVASPLLVLRDSWRTRLALI